MIGRGVNLVSVYMKCSRSILFGVFGLVLHAAASAQIYESEDAEGVPDFSDTPTAGAETVDLPATNIMAAPAAEEPNQPAAASPAADEAAAGGKQYPEQEEGGDVVEYYGVGEDNDPRLQRSIDEGRIDNALPGNSGAGPGTPDAGPGAEPRDGQVGEAAPGERAGVGEVQGETRGR
jgi:hypothetical protein